MGMVWVPNTKMAPSAKVQRKDEVTFTTKFTTHSITVVILCYTKI